MPRTKQVRRAKQSRDTLDDSDILVRNFERQAQMKIHNIEGEVNMAMKSVETNFDVALSRLPSAIKNLTLGEILAMRIEANKENHLEVTSSTNDDFHLEPAPSTTRTKKTSKRNTAVSDDGYATEGGAAAHQPRAPKSSAARTDRRTRSNSRNGRTKLSEVTTTTTVKKGRISKTVSGTATKTDKYKTPAPLKPLPNEYSLITPKMKPNTPMNVLRRPRHGETVLSMQGSPLLVSAVIQEQTANINVPLQNGNIISLLPNDGLRLSHIPQLDTETLRQLETLKGHIEKVIGPK